MTAIRWAATAPAAMGPAAISTSWVALATAPEDSTESRGRPTASARVRSDGPKAWAPWAHRRSSNASGAFPNPMTSNRRFGELRSERSANSSICRWSRRRWIEVSTSGTASVMNPGLLPVLWIELSPCRQARSTRSRTAGSIEPGWWNSPVVVTMSIPASSRVHTSSMSQPWRM